MLKMKRIGILNFKGETAPWRRAEPEISRNETAILHSAVSLAVAKIITIYSVYNIYLVVYHPLCTTRYMI